MLPTSLVLQMLDINVRQFNVRFTQTSHVLYNFSSLFSNSFDQFTSCLNSSLKIEIAVTFLVNARFHISN